MNKILGYNPFQLRHSINDLFDDFFNSPKDLDAKDYLQNIKLDITEDDNNYHLSADLAGVAEKDINLEIDNGVLTLKAKRKHIHKDKKHHLQEKYYGEYQRIISLPENIDTNNIKAKYNNGVLDIDIVKKEKSDAVKKIFINQ